ncbi:MAG: TylF/MycF family methyltransferase [Oscillospiraceae bacterium]|nr:TylF/MycF family methyltransferase [Oscillospiraceae bacterium]
MKNTIFYGAGANMKNIIEFFERVGIPFDSPIWDINAAEIKEIKGHPVSLPDFESKTENQKVVITILDEKLSDDISNKLKSLGFETSKSGTVYNTPPIQLNLSDGLNDEERKFINTIMNEKLSMTSFEQLCATMKACKYVCQNNIPGDFVECGVWRGGNAMIAAWVFEKFRAITRNVWLFDTFEGFENAGIEAGEFDLIEENDNSDEFLYNPEYCKNSLEDVRSNFKKMGLRFNNVCFIKGDVLETLSQESELSFIMIPRKIAVLRMDTDYYESTLRQMQVLYPLISKHGVLIEDDYYLYEGVRKAIADYFNASNHATRPLFQSIGGIGIMGIKIEESKVERLRSVTSQGKAHEEPTEPPLDSHESASKNVVLSPNFQ